MRRLLLAIAAVGLALAGRAQAQSMSASNQTLNVQGIMRTQAGDLQSTAVGLVVSLYAMESASTPFYTQSFTTVPVENGFFSVELSGMNLSFNTPDAWVGIQVAGDASELPRQHLTAVPYAFSADALSSACSGCVSTDMISSLAVSKLEPAGAAGTYLRSDGSKWGASAIQPGDIANIVASGGLANTAYDAAASGALAHLTVNAPAAGFAGVSWNVVMGINTSIGATGCGMVLGVSAVTGAATPVQPQADDPYAVYMFLANIGGQFSQWPIAGHAVVPVVAGANVIYLMRNEGGCPKATFQYYWRHATMTARFESAATLNAVTVQ